MGHRYEADRMRSYRIDEDGNREEMANFIAWIEKEIRYVNGVSTETVLTMRGMQPGDQEGTDEKAIKFDPVDITADQFASMNWVMSKWGSRAILHPGSGLKDDLRAFIQISSEPVIEIVYRHMGWTKLADGRRGYLHAGGAITKAGNDPSVRVELYENLNRYNLSTTADPKAGIKAILDLISLAEPRLTMLLLAGTLAPLFGSVDYAVHLAGRTGTFKSEVMSLFQSFYGESMDARHLPGSWSSTVNALEAQAFYACNAAFTVDDFVPSGPSYQVRAYNSNAERLIRAQGNQAGRARLTDVSALQQTMYPRGIIMSTGEDTPEGHSIRARMMILELSPGDIKPQSLTRAQQARSLYSAGMQWLIRDMAAEPADIKESLEKYRHAFIKIGHSRTPSMMAHMLAVLEYFFNWCRDNKMLTPGEASGLIDEARNAIIEAGEKQIYYMEDSDPTEIFLAAMRSLFSRGAAHVRRLNGGVPDRAAVLGWNVEDDGAEVPMYKSKGPCIGWINWNKNELYIDMTSGIALIRKEAGKEFALTQQTLFRRLKDAGILSRVDESRQRNTIRITAENHPRSVVSLQAAEALSTQEKGEEQDETRDSYEE